MNNSSEQISFKPSIEKPCVPEFMNFREYVCQSSELNEFIDQRSILSEECLPESTKMTDVEFSYYINYLNDRVVDPSYYVAKENRKSGYREVFIGKLVDEIDTIKKIKILNDEQSHVLKVKKEALLEFLDLLKLLKGANPLTMPNPPPIVSKFFKGPIASLKLFENYWFPIGTFQNYSGAKNINEAWEGKNCGENVDLCNRIKSNLTVFEKTERQNEPKNIDELNVIIGEELKLMIERNPSIPFINDLNVQYFLATISEENFGTTMDKMSNVGKNLFFNLVMNHSFSPTAYPAKNDNVPSFGLYHTTVGTHNDTVKNIGSSLPIQNFENCLTVRCQTRSVVWTTSVKLSKLCDYLFGDKNPGSKTVKNRIFTLLENNPKDRKNFLFFCLRLLHRGFNLKSVEKELSYFGEEDRKTTPKKPSNRNKAPAKKRTVDDLKNIFANAVNKKARKRVMDFASFVPSFTPVKDKEIALLNN